MIPDRVPMLDRRLEDPVVAGAPRGRAAGHESSIFRDKLQAEKRRQEFSGPGGGFPRAQCCLEKRKATETGKLPAVEGKTVVEDKTESE